MGNNNFEKHAWSFNNKSFRDSIEKNEIIKNFRKKIIEKKKKEKEKP